MLKGENHPEQFERTMTCIHQLRQLTSTKINKPQPASASLCSKTLQPPSARLLYKHVSPYQPLSVADMKEHLLSKSELVKALHALSPTRRPPKSLPPHVSKEEILEQALAEQNVILDMQQEVMNCLQKENDSYFDKISSQSETIQALAAWEPKAHMAQKKVEELLSHSQLSEDRISSMKKSLSEKEEMIKSLMEKLEASSSTKVATLDSQLQAKRLTVIELEEELQGCIEKLSLAEQHLADKSSKTEVQAAQIKELRESISSLQRINDHQKDQLVSLHSTVTDKVSALASLH